MARVCMIDRGGHFGQLRLLRRLNLAAGSKNEGLLAGAGSANSVRAPFVDDRI